jgi:PGF-pre-PGF domain-containing protein
MKKILLTFFIILFFINIVSAIDDFSVYPNKNINNLEISYKELKKEICPCSFVDYNFNIRNTGTYREIYRLSVNKDVKEWVRFSSDEISIDTNKSVTVVARIMPPCKISPKRYNININVKTEFSRLIATLPLTIDVKSCFDYELRTGKEYNLRTVKPDKVLRFENHSALYNLCEQESIGIPILIINKEDITNTYLFKISPEKWASIVYKKVKLGPYKFTVNHLILNTPNVEEEYEFLLKTITEKGNIDRNMTISVNVNYCYLPNVSVDEVIEVNFTEKSNKLLITNLGFKSADYELSLEPQKEWVKLEPSLISINGKKTKTIMLITKPDEKIAQRDYSLKLGVKVNNTGNLYTFPFKIRLTKKGALDKLFEKIKEFISRVFSYTKSVISSYKWYFIAGIALLIVLIVGITFITHYIKRKKEQRFIESNWLEIRGNREVIFSFEKAKIAIYKISFILKKSVSNVIITVQSYYRKPAKLEKPSGIVYQYLNIKRTHLGDANIKKVQLFFTVKKQWLFQKNVDKKDIILQRFYDNQWHKFKCDIFDEDEDYVYYNTKVPGLSYFAITSELVEVEEKLKPLKLKPLVRADIKKEELLAQEEAKREKKRTLLYIVLFSLIILLSALLYYQFYGIPFLFVENVSKNITIKPEIIKPELNVSEEKVLLIGNFTAEFKEKASSIVIRPVEGIIMLYKWYFLVGFGLLAIFIVLIKLLGKKERLKERPKKKKIKKPSKVIRYVIIILIALLIVIAYFSYITYYKKSIKEENVTKNITVEKEKAVEEEEKEEVILEEPKGIPNQEWNEDTEHIINLSMYFRDPDNDKLFFSSTIPRNIKVEIDNDRGIAILKPRKNWFGKDYVIFTADDLKGGVIKSNNITLIINDIPEPLIPEYISNLLISFYNKIKDFILLYKSYIISGFVMLIIVIVITRYHEQILDFLEESEEDKKKSKRKSKKKIR